MSSYFYLGVGGSGAKLLQTLIHLSAAGMLPEPSNKLVALLVDSDEANGNITACKEVYEAYKAVRALSDRKLTLFQSEVEIRGPWSPAKNTEQRLGEFFDYTNKKQAGIANPNSPDATDAGLMDALFDSAEIDEKISKGFRGRPAIGASILSKTITFDDESSDWYKLNQDIVKNNAATPILLAGSVFGGTGAAGVPTIVNKLQTKLRGEPQPDAAVVEGAPKDKNYLGLVLFLPYFTYDEVTSEGSVVMQADPSKFDAAAAEALRYYHGFEFLKDCHSIYALGEQDKAKMRVPAEGAAEQRNDPHFLELVAGLGALHFYGRIPAVGEEHTLWVAARKERYLLSWDDIPSDGGARDERLKNLKRMILFAVAFRFVFYSTIVREKDLRGSHVGWIQDQLVEKSANLDTVRLQLDDVNKYIAHFLTWLLHLSTPRVAGFNFNLVNRNVFGFEGKDGWELKPVDADIKKLLPGLFPDSQIKLSEDDIRSKARAPVTDHNATGAGKLLRAIQDACNTYKF